MDLIDRDAALQANSERLDSSVERITARWTLADRSYARGWNACTERWLKELASLPSVQIEIIRCKDCKWKDRHNCM